ncbi:MAG: hypothetical protein U0570_09800 [Phycisphaerales bacterium]
MREGLVRVALVLAPAVAALMPARGQSCAPIQVSASSGTANDNFATATGASTDTVVCGAPNRKVGANPFQGQAFVFRFVSAAWNPEGTLTASDGAANDTFGSSVAIAGDTIIVGAPGKASGTATYQGAVYVFTRSGATWTQQAKLTATDGAAGDNFGCSVAIFGDTAIVGAYGKSGGANFYQGAAYVFVRTGSSWTQQAKLTASDGAANDFFGVSVSLGLDAAAIGADGKTISGATAQGAAYVFKRTGTAWAQQARLVAQDGVAGDYFGTSVSLSGSSLAVGALYKASGANAYQGAGYVFLSSGVSWTQQAKLTASDGGAFDYFGSSCVLSGDSVAFGAPNQTIGANPAQGSAYVYVRSGATWTQQSKLLSAAGLSDEWFGASVAFAGSAAVTGAAQQKVGPNVGQGAAYIFGSNIPINIIQQPVSVTNCTQTATAMTITAAGTGPFNYQWQWRAAPAVPAWIPVAAGLNAGGARTFTAANTTGPSLSISGYSQTSGALPFAEFRCLVSNTCGNATSNAATLQVCWCDLNCDQLVDDLDFVFFSGAYNLFECTEPGMPASCPSDFNFDGVVDDVDFAIFATAYDALACPTP